MRAILSCLVTVQFGVTAVAGLVWSDRPAGVKAIRTCAFDGSNVRDLAAGLDDPRGVAIDVNGGRVFFCDRGTGTSTSGRIESVALGGGALQTHLAGLNRCADLCFERSNRTLYWCEENGGMIRRAAAPIEVQTLAPQTLLSQLSSPYYLALDSAANALYWGTSGATLYAQSLDAGTPAVLYAEGQNLRGVAVDPAAGMIYWVERDARVIRRRALSGGSIETLYSGLDTPHGLVLDLAARKLYWVDTGAQAASGFNPRGVSRGEMDGAKAGAAEVVVPGSSTHQPWDIDLDLRTPTYAEWAARFFRYDAASATTGPQANPDDDGLSNLAEYAFGRLPLHADAVSVVRFVVITIEGIDYPALRFRRRQGATDLSYQVNVTSDVIEWSATAASSPPIEVEVASADWEGMEEVVIRSPIAMGASAAQFLRARVRQE